jgi:tRNA threonylcarbamoyl adenosine modification protein YeaZ
MRVLAIDTALAACSAAVLDTRHGSVHGGIVASESAPMTRGHAEALMPLIARVMDSSGFAFCDLDRIVVTTGPGSFTGLRVGISAARGIALAGGTPAIGVSTLSAYAAPHLGADDKSPVVAAIDARHGQVYLQVFAPGGRTLFAPRLAALSDAVRAAAERASCIVGSAAQAVADGLAHATLSRSAPAPAVVEQRDAPNITWVAQIGAVAPNSGESPKPLYLRAPDAQPQNAAQLPRR